MINVRRGLGRKLGSWVGGLLLIAAAVWVVELVRRQDPFAYLSLRESGLGAVGIRLEKVEVTVRRGLQRIAHLQADRVELQRDRTRWWVYKVRAGQLYEEGKPFAQVSADFLEYNSPQQVVLISGSPQVHLLRTPWQPSEPLSLELETLQWNLRARRIASLSPVHLRWKTGSAQVRQMVIDLAEQVLVLKSGEIRLKPDQKNADQERKETKEREVQMRYQRLKASEDRVELEVAEILDGDTLMRADRVIYEEPEKKKHLIATGRLKMLDPRAELTGEKLEAWLKEKRALLTGSVTLVVKPKEEKEQAPEKATAEAGANQAAQGNAKTKEAAQPKNGNQPAEKEEEEEELSPKTLRKYPVLVTCDQIEYFYKKKQAVLTGHLKAVQQLKEGRTRVLTAERAEYDQKKEILTLTGNVVLDDEKGQHFTAGKVVVSVKEGEEWVEIEDGQGTLKVEEEEEEK